MRKNTTMQNLLARVYQNPQYKGKHIIIISGKIYATKTGKAKTQLLNELLEKYPGEIPTITYIPKVESLSAPVGFLSRDDVPPLLGRQECLNRFDLQFFRFVTSFILPG